MIAVLLVLMAINISAKTKNDRMNFLRIQDLEQLKTFMNNPGRDLKIYIDILQLSVDSVLKTEPGSIMNHRCPFSQIDPHDYYSESTYWWPDPKNPRAPYIRKDGVRNPDRFLKHKDDLNALCHSTLLLSTAAYLFDNPNYAEKVRELIRVWFIDQGTRMNPNARYAQIIPNRDQKRGVGILDTRRFVFLLEGVQILKFAGFWDKELESDLQAWFAEYLDWLLNSDYGTDERQRGNNHSTWYAVQVAAFARYTGNQSVVDETWKYASEYLLEKQITDEGKMPLEMERTRSLSYFIFNMDAWSLFARMAESDGIDFWHLENSAGGSLAKSVDYILPFLDNSEKWKFSQITSFRQREQLFLVLGSETLNNSHMMNLYRSVMSPDIIMDEAFLFILNMILKTD